MASRLFADTTLAWCVLSTETCPLLYSTPGARSSEHERVTTTQLQASSFNLHYNQEVVDRTQQPIIDKAYYISRGANLCQRCWITTTKIRSIGWCREVHIGYNQMIVFFDEIFYEYLQSARCILIINIEPIRSLIRCNLQWGFHLYSVRCN